MSTALSLSVCAHWGKHRVSQIERETLGKERTHYMTRRNAQVATNPIVPVTTASKQATNVK